MHASVSFLFIRNVFFTALFIFSILTRFRLALIQLNIINFERKLQTGLLIKIPPTIVVPSDSFTYLPSPKDKMYKLGFSYRKYLT